MLSLPHYVIKKERHHGARHCETEAQKQYHIAFNAWKRCRKRVDGQQEHYEGIHDRFLRDLVFRVSQLKIGWTEEKRIEMYMLAQEDHSYCLSREFQRYQKHWYLTLNKSGKNASIRLRSDFRAAVTIMNRLHRESGKERAEPAPFQQYQRRHPSFSSSSCFHRESGEGRTDPIPYNTKDGTLLPHVLHCGIGTRPKAGGAHEFNSFFLLQ